MRRLCCKTSERADDVSSRPSNDDDNQEMESFRALPDIDVENIAPGFEIRGSIAHFDGGALHTPSQGALFNAPISWHNLSYSVGSKKILRGLTGTALPSRCLAVMGSSGAGKTTFLNAISDRLATSRAMKIKGTRQIGDVEYRRSYRKAIGFVAQDDILCPLATPEGAFRFSLRVRRGTTIEETNPRVEAALQELRLVHCRDTVVGIPGLVSGLSGGERKRCNIGVELICDPKILLLDEPTSGLDSVTSAKIVHLLSELARKGRTVVYTIHQPTAETLTYFDDLMLLTEGHCVYHGTMANSVPYFESIGYPCPDTFTPTDYFMTLLQDSATAAILIKKWKRFLKSTNRIPHTVAIKLHDNPKESSMFKFMNGYIKHFGSTMSIQFAELVSRNALQLLRNRMYIMTHITQSVFFALVLGLIFLNMDNGVSGIQDRQGMLFVAVVNRAMGSAFFMVNSFPTQKPLFIREQQTGSYPPFVYFIAMTVVELPMRLITCLLECCILYWMVGLARLPGPFFYYFGVIALLTEVASGFGFAMSASCPNLVAASAFTPMILVPMMLAAGLFASTSRLRPYWYWLEKLSFFRHAYILVLRNEFRNVHDIQCDSKSKGEQYCLVQAKNGADVMARMGLNDPQSLDWIMWLSLCILYFLFSIITVIALSSAARSKF